MNDFLMIAVLGVSAALLLYWFWPGPALCRACKSKLDMYDYCTNKTCRYYREVQR